MLGKSTIGVSGCNPSSRVPRGWGVARPGVVRLGAVLQRRAQQSPCHARLSDLKAQENQFYF